MRACAAFVNRANAAATRSSSASARAATTSAPSASISSRAVARWDARTSRALVEAGYVSSVAEAFDKLLGAGKPGYVEKERFRISDAVSLIRDAGGLTSIAHPTLYPNHEQLVPKLLDSGIDGIEVMHPDVDALDRERYTNLARFRGKIITGGSDDHGSVKTSETLGTIKVPETMIGPILERL